MAKLLSLHSGARTVPLSASRTHQPLATHPHLPSITPVVKAPAFSPPGQLLSTRRHQRLSTHAAAATEPVANSGLDDALKVLKAAAKGGAFKPRAQEVFEAMRELEKQKQNLPAEGWKDILGGGPAGGRKWRLVFTSGVKEVQKALKGEKGGGFFLPIVACQRFDSQNGVTENGIYLGWIAAMKFSGTFEMPERRLSFDYDKLKLKLGPAKFEFKIKSSKEEGKKGSGPFFTFAYADDDICVARGRGGGIAMWARTTPEWELRNGVV